MLQITCLGWRIFLYEWSWENEGKVSEWEIYDIRHISQVSWYEEVVNFIVSWEYAPGETTQINKTLNHDFKFYIWDKAFFFKQGIDRVVIIWIGVWGYQVLESCHASPLRGHHGWECTAHKVLKYGFFWT